MKGGKNAKEKGRYGDRNVAERERKERRNQESNGWILRKDNEKDERRKRRIKMDILRQTGKKLRGCREENEKEDEIKKKGRDWSWI